MDNREDPTNEAKIIVVDAYDVGVSQLAVVAREQNKRSWHYFCITKPALVDFGDVLIFDWSDFSLYSYRNAHLKYKLQKCALPPIVQKDLSSQHYLELDDEYEKYLPDGYRLEE